MKLRTLIIIVAAAIIIAAIGFYFLTRGGANTAASPGQTGSLPNVGTQQTPPGTPKTPTPAGNFSNSTSSQRFGIISNDPALAYSVDNQNNITIIRPDGNIETVANDNATIISSLKIQNIASAAFSFDGRKILVNYASSSNLQTDVFDMASKSWTLLPAGMQSPVWSPTDYRIAYLQNAGTGSETIAITGAKNPGASIIATLATQDMALQWPNKNTLVVSDKPSVFADGSIWFFNLPNKTLTPVAAEYPGAESAWGNATSTLGLIFSSNPQNSGGRLSFIGAGGNPKAVSFTTLPSKCGFSIETSTSSRTSSPVIYCAVPRDQQTFSIARLPDEYEQKILFTADDIYKINTTDGTLTTIFNDSAQTLDATKLKVFNNTLFFINRYDSKLYAISLQ